MSYAKIIKSRKSYSPPLSMEDMMPVPSIFITDKDYPEIKDWKVGKKYTIEVRMTSRTEEQNGEVRGHFELVGESKEQTAKDTMES